MKRVLPYLSLFLILSILGAGCGGPKETEVPPEQLVLRAVGHMATLDGFEFQITLQGAQVFLDADNTVQFAEAVGHYVAPNQAQTTVTITALGMLTEITVISLEGNQWASNPLTGQFQELPDTYLFKPTQYLDPSSGFFPSLGDGLFDLTLVGEEELEELPGLTLTHISGTIPGAVISEISKGLINIESLKGDLWMDAATNEVHRVVLSDTADGEASSVWTFDFWSFGETIEITAP